MRLAPAVCSDHLNPGIASRPPQLAASFNQAQHVTKRGLIAVVPIGAFWRVLVQMPLIDSDIRRFIGHPFSDALHSGSDGRYAVLVDFSHAGQIQNRRGRPVAPFPEAAQ
jgi:hypothetical protein